MPLDYDALNSIHCLNLDPELSITWSAPAVVAVEGDAIVASSPGRATVTLAADEALFVTDYKSGLWSFTVERPVEERPIS